MPTHLFHNKRQYHTSTSDLTTESLPRRDWVLSLSRKHTGTFRSSTHALSLQGNSTSNPRQLRIGWQDLTKETILFTHCAKKCKKDILQYKIAARVSLRIPIPKYTMLLCFQCFYDRKGNPSYSCHLKENASAEAL